MGPPGGGAGREVKRKGVKRERGDRWPVEEGDRRVSSQPTDSFERISFVKAIILTVTLEFNKFQLFLQLCLLETF